MGNWDAVVDVSNVCWSPYLSPVGRQAPVWDRLGLVMSAWRELHGPDTQFELVADESLPRVLDRDARSHFTALRESGIVRTASVADGEILRLARAGELHVISRDHYLDHRSAHRWIDRFPDRFHAWSTVDESILFEPLGIKPRSAQDISQAVEVKAIRWSAKLDARNQAHRKILQTRWQCENTACRQAAQWQGQVLMWPRVSPEGSAVCPSCRRALVALGPRATLHEVVVEGMLSEAEIMRFPLEVDCPVIVGRGAAIKGIDLAMYADGHAADIAAVSRQHLMLQLQDAGSANWRLGVLDLKSTNGTTVQRWNGGGFHPDKEVLAGEEIGLGTRDRLVLGATVLLRLSGKRYLADPAGAPPAPSRPATPAGATVVVRRPGSANPA
jgi:hypothetical protein